MTLSTTTMGKRHGGQERQLVNKKQHYLMKKSLLFSAILFYLISLFSCKEKPIPPTLKTTAVTEIGATSATSGGAISDDGGAQVTLKGICFNSTGNPTTEDEKTTINDELVSFISTITQLSPNTKYYVRAYATNSAGTGYGETVSFTTLGQAPKSVTLSVSNVQSNTATLNGSVNPNYLPTTITFEWGETTSYGNTASPTQNILDGNTEINVSANITGLAEGTIYHVRIKSSNQIATVYGEDVQFTTQAKPDLMTVSITNTTTTSALITCNIISNFGLPISESGICWGMSEDPTISDNIIINATPACGYYIINITDLTPNTIYYLRAYAINSIGTGYGNGLKLKTFSGTMMDSDGNTYFTVDIGEQTWMAENLKTTKYNDGTAIPLVADNEQWGNLLTPAYCWFQNDYPTYGTAYGALYNWYTVKTEILCPTGWHVPTDNDWTILENYLVNNGFNYDGSMDFNKVAKSLATTHNWTSSLFTGSPGNTDFPYKRNASGFSALAGGFRFGQDGMFTQSGEIASWWTSSYTYLSNTSVYRREIRFIAADCRRLEEGNLRKGLSVRCLKN